MAGNEKMIMNDSNNPPPTANIQLGLWVGHQSLLAACTEPTLTPLILLHSPHYNTPVTITALINYHFLVSSFVIAEEDLRIETSYPFNEVTAVFLLNNPRYHHTSHSDEPLSYHFYTCLSVALVYFYTCLSVALVYFFVLVLYACLFLCTLCVIVLLCCVTCYNVCLDYVCW